MAERKVNQGLRQAIELGPVIAFFAAYMLLRDRVFEVGGAEYSGFIAATAIFIPLIAAATWALWRMTGKISRMQVVTLVLVLVFGGITIWLNDERFFKVKPTIIYGLFGAILGFGLLRGRSYLQYVLEGDLKLAPETWKTLTLRLALFFFAMAGANEVVWRTMSTDAWVTFKTFVLTFALFAFLLTQWRLFAADAAGEEEGGGG